MECNHLVSTYSLWSRVNVHLYSLNTITYLTDSVDQAYSPLRTYLMRSIPPSNTVGLPLDTTIKSHFNYLDEGTPAYMVDIQLRHLLHCLTGRLPNVVQNTILLEEEFIPRWRSFEIDLESIKPYDQVLPALSLQSLWAYGRTPLPLLERLVARNVHILLSDKKQTPNLKILDLSSSTINLMPDLQSVHYLNLRDVKWKSTPAMINWEECKNMQTIHIHTGILFDIPSSHSFPYLTCVRVDRNSHTILALLGTIFNGSRLLKTLEIKETMLVWITLAFRGAPTDFRVEELAISSCSFKSRPSDKYWNWLEYGEYTWGIAMEDIREARELLQELKTRPGIRVKAMDAQMEAILNLSK